MAGMFNQESFQEFSQRHGGNGLNVENTILFPDGAQCDAGTGDFRMDPHPHPVMRLRQQIKYYQEKVRRLEQDFLKMKSQIEVPGGDYDLNVFFRNQIDGRDQVQALKQMKAKVLEGRSILKQHQDQLNQLPEEAERNRREQGAAAVDRQESERILALKQQVKDISI